MDRLTYSIKEACKLLGVSRSFLYNCWKADVGPPRRRIGKRVVLPADGLRIWTGAAK